MSKEPLKKDNIVAITESRSVRLAPDLWDKVEAYWHRNRLPSRTAAVRELIEKGLKK